MRTALPSGFCRANEGKRTRFARALLSSTSSVLVALSVVTCGDSPLPSRPATTVRDSSGVRVVESLRPVWQDVSALSIHDTPSVTIGGVDTGPEYSIGYVADARRLSDGRIVIIDGQANHLLTFDQGGSFIQAWGREGEGPGEFRRPEALALLPGDSVVVFDDGNRSASVFAPSGAFVRRVAHPIPFAPPSGMSTAESCCVPVGAGADGSIFWRLPETWSGVDPGPTTTVLVRLDAGGSDLDTLGNFHSGWAQHVEGRTRRLTFTTQLAIHVSGLTI